jgi:hypothetical protein
LPAKEKNADVITINANVARWANPSYPPMFRNCSFNWFRTQMMFYLMRFKPQTFAFVQQMIAHSFQVPSVDFYRPYIAVYVRRSDKVQFGEMSQAYQLRQYFDLFDTDARRANITNVYLNSEDENVYKEFAELNKQRNGYYKLMSIKSTKNVVFRSLTRDPQGRRTNLTLEFLTDLFIESHADLHAGTLTSNWCRLVDEFRLALGKTIMYYTPENKYKLDY